VHKEEFPASSVSLRVATSPGGRAHDVLRFPASLPYVLFWFNVGIVNFGFEYRVVEERGR
jgi:hypothetical protein